MLQNSLRHLKKNSKNVAKIISTVFPLISSCRQLICIVKEYITKTAIDIGKRSVYHNAETVRPVVGTTNTNV